jgi:hypothetical protein
MRVTVIATGFDQKEVSYDVMPAATVATGSVKTTDVSDIDDIFKIFNR